MFSLRSKSESARIASAATLAAIICVLLAAIPAFAAAAPAEGEEPAAPQLAFEPGSYDFGLHEVNRENAQNNFQLRNVGSVPAPIYSIKVVGSGSGAIPSNRATPARSRSASTLTTQPPSRPSCALNRKAVPASPPSSAVKAAAPN
jgi:hypothetical protein